jgi:ABC-type enterochelin transport system ATPase subunit
MWSVDPKDFDSSDLKTIAQRATSELQRGTIVLLHDNDSTQHTITQIVAFVIDRMEQQGFTSAPLPLC